jgi:WD40 repeat protein
MHQDSGRAIAFSPDGRLAASGAEDIVLWDALTHKKLGRFRPQVGVSSLAFSPNGHWLVSAHGDGAILIWDTTELELVGDFAGHSEAVNAVAFAPDGKRIASASEDGSVIVWDIQHNQKEGALLWHPIQVNAVAFSADSKWLVSNDLDGNVAMWDVAARKLRWARNETKRVPAEASYGVAVSPDGSWVATSYGVYDGGTGKLIYDFRAELPALPSAGQSVPQPTEIRSLTFTADGRALLTVSTRTGVIVRQAEQWQPRETQKPKDRRFVSLGVSPDSKQLVTGEDGKLVQLWMASPLRPTDILGQHTARIKSVAFSPDGTEVVSAGDDKTIALWEVAGRRHIANIGLHTSPVYAVAWSPDGRQIISGEHDHSVRLYTRRRSLWGWSLD